MEDWEIGYEEAFPDEPYTEEDLNVLYELSRIHEEEVLLRIQLEGAK